VPVEFCKANGIRIGRVPSYSPSSIAEYAISSIMALAKNIQKSYELTKEADFTIGGLQVPILPKVTDIDLQIFVSDDYYIFVMFNQHILVRQFFANILSQFLNIPCKIG
jgi:hypothetical protein